MSSSATRDQPGPAETPSARIATRRGEVILDAGQGAGMTFRVERGCVALFKALPGKRSICVGLLGPNDIFSQEIAGLEGNGVSAEALTDAICVPVEIDALIATMSASPEIARSVLLGLTRRVTESQTLIARLLSRDITLRLAGSLLDLCDRFGEPGRNGMTAIGIPVPHKMLARMIGGNRVTVTRVMTDLRGMGLVASPGRNQILVDLERMREYVAGER